MRLPLTYWDSKKRIAGRRSKPFIFGSIPGSPPVIPPSTGSLLLVIAGQSNALGFGTTGTDVPTNLQAAQPNVYIYRDIGTGGDPPTYAFATPYQAGVNSLVDQRGGNQKFGLEAEFARNFAATTTKKLWIVRAAGAGTQLEDTDIVQIPGTPTDDWCPDNTSESFEDVIVKLGLAMPLIVGTYDILVVWMQGESDALDAGAAAHYYTNISYLISQARARWGIGSVNEFYLCRIRSPLRAYSPIVRTAIATAAVDSANTKMVNTDDCELLGDSLHYSAVGIQSLGLNVWNAYNGTQTAITLPSTFSFTMTEQAGNGTVIGTIAPSNSPNPTAQFELVSGETSGITINNDTGVLSVSNGALLTFAGDPTRIFVVRAANGVNAPTTTVTLNLTQAIVTDVANTRFRFDPNDAAFYTVATGTYTNITDTKGSGRVMAASASNRRPTQQTFPGTTKNGMFFSDDDGTQDSMWMAVASTFCNDTDTDFTMACVCRPKSTGTSTQAWIMALMTSTTARALAVFYDFTTQKFGANACVESTGAVSTARETGTNPSPPDITYRVRLRKAGQTVQLFVNDVERTLSGFAGANRNLTLAATLTGGPCLAGGAQLPSAAFEGDIGLGRFINGNLSGGEVSFLNTELLSWIS